MAGKTLIIFDFWGAGNMGDDLMVDGFVRGLEELKCTALGRITSLCNHDIGSQKRRFPQINWIKTNDEIAFRSALGQAETVIGFGGTPFQVTSGDWLLDHLVRVFGAIRGDAKVIFINVGAEAEILPRAEEFSRILRRVNHCSVRDEFSHGVLEKLGVKSAAEIHVGGDFANISLPMLLPAVNRERKRLLGVVLGNDTLSNRDMDIIKKFLEDFPSSEKIAFITGDVRDYNGMEYSIYKKWTKLLGFSPLRRKLLLQRPKYSVCTMRDFIHPFAECETIISSRYHGLLTAAWLGCKVAAIGRSSKVVALANALNVPVVKPPINPVDLNALHQAAVAVAPERLEEFRKASLAGLQACLAP